MTRTCPKCASQKVHQSHRRGATEHLIALVGFKVRRCHDCGLRFAALRNSTLWAADIQKAFGRVYSLALMLAALAMVLSLVLWFSGKQAAFPSD